MFVLLEWQYLENLAATWDSIPLSKRRSRRMDLLDQQPSSSSAAALGVKFSSITFTSSNPTAFLMYEPMPTPPLQLHSTVSFVT